MREIHFGIFAILVYLTIFSINFIPIKDPDFGWHYRCGQNLLQGQPCISNSFSYYLATYKSYYASFLFDATTAVIYNFFGLNGLSFLHAAVITGVFYIFHKLTKQDIIISAIAFLVAEILSWSSLDLGWRSQILTYLMVLSSIRVLTYRKIIKIPKTNINLQSIWLYPLIMIFWVNAHIGFFTGLIIYGTYFIDMIFKWIKKKLSNMEFIEIAVCGFVTIISTLINPYTYKVYIEIYNHTYAPLNTMIAEWVAPPTFYVFIIILSLVAILSLNIIYRKMALHEILLLIFFGAITVMARRNTYLYFTFMTIYFLYFVPKINIKSQYILLWPFIAAIFISTIVIRIPNTLRFNNNFKTFCTQGAANYPCEAIQKYKQLSGNVYAAYEWGGFLIWKRPDVKVFVDGRMTAWNNGSSEFPYQTYLKILQSQKGWNELLRKYNTDYILIAQGTFLDLLLDKQADIFGWKKVYEDKSHAIFKNIK